MLVDTIDAVLAVVPAGTPLLIVDQTPRHEPAVLVRLEALARDGAIERIVLSEPSITRAMNAALAYARSDHVLFLDDDVTLEPGFVEAHLDAHAKTGATLVAGRVIQPWQEGVDFSTAGAPPVEPDHFAYPQAGWISRFMGGNFSVDRDAALALGGFDENFVRVAYQFEAEFAHRLCRGRPAIFYAPAATIHHLKVPTGGTRAYGEHLRTARPDHAVGAYYFILKTWDGRGSALALLRRPWRAMATRHHLRRPWWIPLTLVGELRGFVWAVLLAVRGPRHVGPADALRSRTGG